MLKLKVFDPDLFASREIVTIVDWYDSPDPF
jgi:hypothetical protein